MNTRYVRLGRCWAALSIVGISLLSGCATSAHSTLSVTPTVTASIPSTAVAARLPAFSDWRLTYMAGDNSIHVVTLDGQTDITGPQAPFAPSGQNVPIGSGIVTSGIAPDGHTLAYATEQGLAILDLTGQHPITMQYGPYTAPNQMAWSPDNRYLALGDGAGRFWLDKVSDGSITTIPGTPFPAQELPGGTILVGWLDTTHIAVERIASSASGAPWNLYALNVTSGASQVLASFSEPQQQSVALVVNPTFSKILYYYISNQGVPLNPSVGIYDVANGSSTTLPAVAQLQDKPAHFIHSFVWQPGRQSLALSTGFIINGDLKNWLVDLQNDSITPLPNVGYPVGWSPDGKTLILSSDLNDITHAGPFTLTALTFGANGQTTQTVLTKQAYNFNFIGFVRTASGG